VSHQLSKLHNYALCLASTGTSDDLLAQVLRRIPVPRSMLPAQPFSVNINYHVHTFEGSMIMHVRHPRAPPRLNHGSDHRDQQCNLSDNCLEIGCQIPRHHMLHRLKLYQTFCSIKADACRGKGR
jgi:hypothetical protein